MKLARILILAIALLAAGVAAMLVSSMTDKPQAVVQNMAEPQRMVDVLVASTDISLGNVVVSSDMVWRAWPEDAVQASYITRSQQPEAMKKLGGSTARAQIFNSEPINASKLVSADGGGFLSAILQSGMRAVSTSISAETGAGGFILPNDHVDVILTRRVSDPRRNGQGQHTSETVLRNIRVLAIDQTIKEKDGKKVVVGRTATMAVKPRQAELIALAKSMGNISLSLRSLQDVLPGGLENGTGNIGEDTGGSITVLRYGIASSVTNTR